MSSYFKNSTKESMHRRSSSFNNGKASDMAHEARREIFQLLRRVTSFLGVSLRTCYENFQLLRHVTSFMGMSLTYRAQVLLLNSKEIARIDEETCPVG